MSYRHVTVPESGDKITVSDNRLVVTDNPILGFVEGDGTGPNSTWARRPPGSTTAIIFRPRRWTPSGT